MIIIASGTGFPTTLDSFIDKIRGDDISFNETNKQSSAIEALQAKIGIDSSAVTTSHDYKLQHTVNDTGNQTIAGVKTLSSNPILTGLTASEIVATDGNKALQSLPVATYPSLTELSYVKGLTSSVQTQITDKISKTIVDAKGDLIVGTAADTVSRLAVSATNGQLLQADSSASTGLSYVDRANPNYIINGNFDFWQRGDSFSTPTGLGYSVDRMAGFFTTSTCVITKESFTLGQTDVPGEPKYYFRNTVTSVAGAGNRIQNAFKIESVRTLAGKTATLSFYAKADAAKNIAVEFLQNFGTGGSPSAGVTGIGVTICTLTTSWQKFTVTVNIPSISGKTLGTDNNSDFFQIGFWFDAGSNFNSRTNSLGQQSGTFDIARVKLEEGSIATPFVLAGGTLAGELVACQRYYEKTYNINVAPRTATYSGCVDGIFAYNTYTLNQCHFPYKVSKRTASTVKAYSPTTGTVDRIRNASSGADLDVTSGFTTNSGTEGFNQTCNNILTAANWYEFHWTAEAEL